MNEWGAPGASSLTWCFVGIVVLLATAVIAVLSACIRQRWSKK
jgi:hypothetical protein